MRIGLSMVMAVPLALAGLGGCAMLGMPEEWCGLAATGLWATGLLGLTALWAPQRRLA